MNKLMAALRTHSILILFGFVITSSLFLGDGKQPLIDAVWACETVLLYAIYYLQNKKLHTLPRALHIAWTTLLGYCVVWALFSDSVGYSLSTVIRLFDAYLIYCLFYSLADKKHTRFFNLGVIITIICVIATIVSFGCLLFPQLVQSFPQMNLLYATYGHNQLAGLLLFGIPLVITMGVPIPSWCKKIVLLLLLSGIFLSFARGAWILLAAYFAFLLVTKRPVGKFNTSMMVVYMGAVAGLLITMFLLAPRLAHEPQISGNVWLYKQTIKPPVYESRIRYWLQAASAIRERPIFGSGPGTFYLQSKRFQSAPLSYSWFAHSFVLEQFVEIGLVGVVLWGILFVIQGRLLIRSRNHAFLTGVILTFLYSLYEYNLNFIVIWLLFWSALGWLTGSAQFKKTSSPEPSFLVTGGIVLLFAFSLLSVGSTQATMGNNGDLASLFAPFVADIAKTSIENHTETVTPIQKKELSLLLFFHKKNPEILYAVAKYYAAMKQPNDAIWWYKAAISQDPKNFVYQQEYLQFVIENGFFSQAGPAIRQFSLHMLPARLHNEITSGSLTSSDLIAAWPSIGINELESNPPDLYFAKLYYLLGEQVLDKNILLTRQLWTLARDIYPDMGLLYHELASLEFYSFHDMNKAQKIIAECMRIPHATLHCKQISQNLENVPPPGYVTGDIVGYR